MQVSLYSASYQEHVFYDVTNVVCYYFSDDADPDTIEVKQNRRAAHSVAEQKRRDAIRVAI